MIVKKREYKWLKDYKITIGAKIKFSDCIDIIQRINRINIHKNKEYYYFNIICESIQFIISKASIELVTIL